MIAYRIAVTSMMKEAQPGERSDVVTRVYWRMTGRDVAGSEQSASGSTRLAPPEPEGFIAFAALGEDQVLAWIEGSREVEKARADIGRALQEAAPSIENVPPPWAEPAAEDDCRR